MAQQSYLVKILSGSNMGAEIELYSTSILVGDSDECDIILGDPFLERRTFSIDIFEDSVTIKSEGLPFYIDGKSVKEPEFTAKFYSVITVGTTSFVIGETDVLWPDITTPEHFEEESEEEELVEEANDQEEEENSEEEDEEEDEDSFVVEEEPISVLENPKEYVKQAILHMTLSQVLISLGAIGLFVYVLWFWFLRAPLFGSEEYLKDIHLFLREKGYEKLRVGVRKPDLLIITGYVMDKEDILKVENLVYNKAPKVSLYIRALNEVLQFIQEYLTLNQIFITVKYNIANNSITFTGYVKDEDILKKIQKDWENYLPIFKEVVWKITYWETIKPVLDTELHNADLNTTAIVTPYDYTIHISGDFTDPDIKHWENIKASLLGTFGLTEKVITEDIDRVRLRANARLYKIEPSPDRMKGVIDEELLTIMGVRKEVTKDSLLDLPHGTNFDEIMEKDPCRYISVIPGEVLFVGINGEEGLYTTGSMLPGKLKIIDILEKSIVLENKEETYIFCNTE